MNDTATKLPDLTNRERQVAGHIMRGDSNKEIATALGISYETVKEHMQHILRKFGVDRRERVAIRMICDKLSGKSQSQLPETERSPTMLVLSRQRG